MADIVLPEGWSQRLSKSHHGRAYFVNKWTGATTWDVPTRPASAGEDKKVQCLHILKKHAGSRRPASWRVNPVVQVCRYRLSCLHGGGRAGRSFGPPVRVRNAICLDTIS